MIDGYTEVLLEVDIIVKIERGEFYRVGGGHSSWVRLAGSLWDGWVALFSSVI